MANKSQGERLEKILRTLEGIKNDRANKKKKKMKSGTVLKVKIRMRVNNDR